MNINAFITGVKNGQVQREITLLHHLVAFNTAAKESLCMGYRLLQNQERERERERKTRKSHPSLNPLSNQEVNHGLISNLNVQE
jgi:hypothetical protein